MKVCTDERDSARYAEQDLLKGNALIRSNLHVDPATLTPEKWAQHFAEALWLEGERLRNTARMLVDVFSHKD